MERLRRLEEDEAKKRREHLQELREKFLVSRKHRLMGKPYHKAAAKKQANPGKESTVASKGREPEGVAVGKGQGKGVAVLSHGIVARLEGGCRLQFPE